MPPSLWRVGAVALAACLWATACGDDSARATDTVGARIADVPATMSASGTSDDASADAPIVDSEVASLTRAAGGPSGTEYTVRTVPTPGVILGRITGGSPRDTGITPTHDLAVCRPFSQSIVPSSDGGVGNGVVWLIGVASGPRDDAPRRVKLTLDGCRLEPRVQRVAVGSTVLVNGRDAMMSRLQFTAAGETRSRTTVLLSDVGQIVPTSDATSAPALVQVTDDMHPWVRAWLVVAPHPYVAVTGADGEFHFDNVPPGRYTLVAWHERLGVKQTKVRVEAAVQTRLEVAF
ncbi:MAG: carboxypeptidase regulatory-like domain-containing protein [Gemmatimonas sp.]|nr:carboxypeptidase regulatory-like domain-containing protein [Gemmatimonas sp.]